MLSFLSLGIVGRSLPVRPEERASYAAIRSAPSERARAPPARLQGLQDRLGAADLELHGLLDVERAHRDLGWESDPAQEYSESTPTEAPLPAAAPPAMFIKKRVVSQVVFPGSGAAFLRFDVKISVFPALASPALQNSLRSNSCNAYGLSFAGKNDEIFPRRSEKPPPPPPKKRQKELG